MSETVRTGRVTRLPKGGQNIFGEVKGMRTAVESTGADIWPMSIGQPVGPALRIAKVFIAAASLMPFEDIDGYQDNGAPGVTKFFDEIFRGGPEAKDSIDLIKRLLPDFDLHSLEKCPDFAREFSQAHSGVDLGVFRGLDYVPIPGIKPILGYVISACQPRKVATMSFPGYPTPAYQCGRLGVEHQALPLTSENNFLVSPDDVDSDVDLIMVNYPNNPTGQISTEGYWHDLCSFCETYGKRLFNDGAYNMLAPSEHSPLKNIAIHYPGLSWAESDSESKMGANFTGHRVGAIVGSDDFVGDIKIIKGNSDSGFYAPAAVGAIIVLRYAMEEIMRYRQIFQRRQKLFCKIALSHGMRPVVDPKGTFFNLWETPKRAFGQDIRDSKHFNEVTVHHTGLLAVHIAPECIRYAVVADIENEGFTRAIEIAFELMKPGY